MTPETQTLVERLEAESEWFGSRKWGDTWLKQHGEAAGAAMQDAAAAITTLARDLETARGASAADDARLRSAEERVWPGVTHGCDAAEWLADELLSLRRDLETARQEREAALARLGQEQIQRRKEVADLSAAVRAARAETWASVESLMTESARSHGIDTGMGRVLTFFALHAAWRKRAEECEAVAAPAPEERKYPCEKCGKLRTKAEGGTTFTVCDTCWDTAMKAPAPETPAPDAMPAIKVGDTIVHGKHPAEPPMFMHRVTEYERRGWQDDPNVVEILRPIWRRQEAQP